jgi:hypothetical protein
MSESIGFEPRSIVLRRFANEALELLPSGPGLIRVSSSADAGAQVYGLALSPGCGVRPVDWRRVAYDHVEVQRRLRQCTVDNTADAMFAPMSAQLLKELAARIRLALADLSSVFDVVDVTCEAREDVLVVAIDGEFKNGERVTIVFQDD